MIVATGLHVQLGIRRNLKPFMIFWFISSDRSFLHCDMQHSREKKWDPKIQNPDLFLGQILRKTTQNSDKY